MMASSALGHTGSTVYELTLDDQALNRFPALPATLCSLSAQRNRLKNFDGIPHTITALNVSRNVIESFDLIPLGLASSLRQLDISSNDIISMLHLPPQLQQLDVSRNMVHVLEGIDELSKLQSLSCEGNQIHTIRLSHSPSVLRLLKLSNNRLAGRLDQVLPAIPTLRELWVDNNSLSELGHLRGFDSLHLLSVRRNQLTIRCSLQLPVLQIIDLSHNQLDSVAGLDQCVRLDNIAAVGNLVAQFDGPLPVRLRSLDLRCVDLNDL